MAQDYVEPGFERRPEHYPVINLGDESQGSGKQIAAGDSVLLKLVGVDIKAEVTEVTGSESYIVRITSVEDGGSSAEVSPGQLVVCTQSQVFGVDY